MQRVYLQLGLFKSVLVFSKYRDSVDRMPALTRLAHSAIAEAIAFADLLDKLEPERRRSPTPCAEWTIDDLAAHVASGAFRDAEAFHRARLGTSSPPGELAIENTTSPRRFA